MVYKSGIVTWPCSVEIFCKDLKNKPDQVNFIGSRSGLFLCHKKTRKGFVLTTGLKTDIKSINGDASLSSQNELVKVYFKKTSDPSSAGYTLKATQLCLWKCQSFCESLTRLIIPQREWSFPTDSSEAVNNVEDLTWFVLYDVDVAFLTATFWERIHYSEPTNCSINPGKQVLTRSYPFGSTASETFSDTFSRGIISNMDSKTNSLFLIDARCLPGSEGGGVYYMDHQDINREVPRQLIGMIVAPLCSKNEELVGFTICCSVNEIISSLLKECANMNLFRGKETVETISVLESWLKDLSQISWYPGRATTRSSEPDVLRVTSGDLWGSGVVVGAKLLRNKKAEVYVITCRHVLRRQLDNSSPVYLHFDGKGSRYHGRVLFSTDEASCFDLALIGISCESSLVHHLFLEKIPSSLSYGGKYNRDLYTVPHIMKHYHYQKGDPVYVKGHCLFDVPSLMSPSVSAGVLSAVVNSSCNEFSSNSTHCTGESRDKIPILLHSTCTVHKGASGGGLICRRISRLKGIVINHVRDEERKVSYPQVNFSIPACVFMPAVLNYLKTDDKSFMDILNCKSKTIQNIWTLNDEQETIEKCSSEVLRSKL